MRALELKIVMRFNDGKQAQFTMRGDVPNSDIPLPAVAIAIEQAINNYTSFRAHADIVESSQSLDTLSPIDPRD